MRTVSSEATQRRRKQSVAPPFSAVQTTADSRETPSVCHEFIHASRAYLPAGVVHAKTVNRYSRGQSILHVGSFLAPLTPLVLLAASRGYMSLEPSLPELVLLWIIGLGISYMLIIVHELGHVIGGRVAGLEITKVNIGHWRRLVSFRLGKTELVFRVAPASGYVTPRPSIRLLSLPRVVLFLISGIASEGAVVLLAWKFLPSPGEVTSFDDLMIAFCRFDILLVGTFQTVLNALPLWGQVGGDRHPTDGMQLLGLWRNRRQRPTQRHFMAECEELNAQLARKDFPAALISIQTLLGRHSDNRQLRQTLASVHATMGNTHQAEAIWRDLLSQPGLTPLVLAEYLDNLSCLPLYHGRTDLLPEAEAWINEALRHAPDAITLKGTRGGLLVELGRIDEAISTLRHVIKRSECPIDRMISSACLAKAWHSKGELSAARKWLARATAIDPTHPLVRRIALEICPADCVPPVHIS